MSAARFPSTHLILPEFRQVALKQTPITENIRREKDKLEFQRLLELSWRNKIVLHIISSSKTEVFHSTGIVTGFDSTSGVILLQTIEGQRRLMAHKVQNIWTD